MIFSSFSVSLLAETLSIFERTKKKKALSKSFVDLIIINTVVPIQFAYAKSRGIDITEGLIQLLNEVVSEKNAIMDKFKSFCTSSECF
jgi:hypothetical protein